MNKLFPFIGREKEMARLRQLHKQRKNVLLLGAEGIGKSALVEQLHSPLGLWVCPHSEHLSEICESLERELELADDDLLIVKRKNRILSRLKMIPKLTVVFDGASWTTPKIGNFIENVSMIGPVWLCTRSEHPWDIGRIWPLLVRFEHIELESFHPKEAQRLVAAAIQEKIIPEKTSGIVDWLHRRSEGNPKILCELLIEIARGHYDLSNLHSLRLLDLDRRIHEIFPAGISP
ncbi:MAG TPA: ATP-binding protein [Verrucomicrobiae bacterium]|nr:ATP-binding protein [Verrucomicrobiae bacterium]